MFKEPGRNMFGRGGGGIVVDFDGQMLMEAELYVQQHASPHPVERIVETRRRAGKPGGATKRRPRTVARAPRA